MINHVGPLTTEFLKRCGYSTNKINAWTGETRLFQDMGLSGDSAKEEVETMRREYDVDFTGFSIERYFPSELSNDTFVSTLFGWSKFGRRIKEKYPAITFSMIEKNSP